MRWLYSAAMPEPLVPAVLAFTEAGTPYSAAFGDVYHSAAGGPAQARHVFLGGNGLPERWRGHECFTILETGFGLGTNFLATWAEWKADPQRCHKLHFVSVEKHPFHAADLLSVHAPDAQLGPLARELCDAWPMLVPGMHRMAFEGGGVVLTLAFAEIATALAQLRLSADALYLDGFAPAKNPEMWAAPLFRRLSRLAAPEATLATYTAASAVRDALLAAGFSVEKRAGFAAKRDMLCGRHIGSARADDVKASRREPAGPGLKLRRAIVIGGGLAGSAVCERLATRGWDITLLERNAAPAMEASGNHAGAFHPLVTRDDSVLAQLTRAAFVYALSHWRTLPGAKYAECGVLQMPRSDDEDLAQRGALTTLAYPPAYARHLSATEASKLAGTELATGGVWFARGGWVRPRSLVEALLAKAGAVVRLGNEVATLTQEDIGWAARDASGAVLADAPVVILANAGDATRLAAMPDVELRSVRGQVTYLPPAAMPPVRVVLLRGGMVIPPVQGIAVAGATFDIGDTDAAPRTDSHAGNLERLARILPGAGAGLDPASLEGRVGFRAVARDRLPLVGALPGSEGLFGAFAYGSRGILWCSLMAEILACRVTGEPCPVEARLADAVDPARFARRAARSAVRPTPGAGSPGSRP